MARSLPGQASIKPSVTSPPRYLGRFTLTIIPKIGASISNKYYYIVVLIALNLKGHFFYAMTNLKPCFRFFFSLVGVGGWGGCKTSLSIQQQM